MVRKRIITDLSSCRALWERLVRPRNVSDMWEFRLCFCRHFNRPPHFLLLDDREGVAGMLPLCYVEEEDTFVFFPGEIWKGKTWLERTPFYARDADCLFHLLSECPERTYLRYVEGLNNDPAREALEEDELGYLLYPPLLGFDISGYLQRFSTKRLKNIRKEIASVVTPNGAFHLGRLHDFDLLIHMNVERFGADSYFYDPRFRESFRDLMRYLHSKGILRMLSLEVRGETVAVDLGAIYRGTYVVFMGGTHPGFPGVSKAMNMHHIEFAFNRRLARIDFLCGDFHWKKLWHLDPEALYKFVTPALRPCHRVYEEEVQVPMRLPDAVMLHLKAREGGLHAT
jgi:hypothetical protein